MNRNNNNDPELQRVMRETGNNDPEMEVAMRESREEENLRRALKASENEMNRARRQREREEKNAEYERAYAANLEAARIRNSMPKENNVGLNEMIPGLYNQAVHPATKRNNKTANNKSANRVATPEKTSSLAEEFPEFSYTQVERLLVAKKGNVNATRKNLIRRRNAPYMRRGGKKSRKTRS